MSNQLVRASTINGFRNLLRNSECVRLRHLTPSSTVLVRTVNSLYRLVVTAGPEVYVQGGRFFPEETSVHIDGASIGGSCLRVGCICVGLRVEIRSGDLHIVTSPVLAIATVPAGAERTNGVRAMCDHCG